MNFSIKAIIRALVVPEHRLVCSTWMWRRILAELERRGEHSHESGSFFLVWSAEASARFLVRSTMTNSIQRPIPPGFVC